MVQSAEQRILYETSVHAELRCPATADASSEETNLAQGRLGRIFSWGPLCGRVGRFLGYHTVPPAVGAYLASRPDYVLAASTDGEHIAILTRAGLVVLAQADNYECDETTVTWAMPAVESHRRWTMAWGTDAQHLTVAADAGTIRVLSIEGRERCKRQAPANIAGLVLLVREELVSVICVTLGGQLYWLSAEHSADCAALPPATADVLPAGQNSCVSAIHYDARSETLFIGGSCGGAPNLNAWRICGEQRSVTPLLTAFSTAVLLPAPTPPAGMGDGSGNTAADASHACCRLRLSPSRRNIAAVDSGGRVIIWAANCRSAPVAFTVASDVVDVCWWDDEALALLHSSGALVVRALSDGANLFRNDQSESFNPPSAICSVADSPDRCRLVILEGPDASASKQDRALTVCSLRQVTPQESLATKLQNRE